MHVTDLLPLPDPRKDPRAWQAAAELLWEALRPAELPQGKVEFSHLVPAKYR